MLPSRYGAAWVVGEYSGYLQQDQIVNVFASLVSSAVIYLPVRVGPDRQRLRLAGLLRGDLPPGPRAGDVSPQSSVTNSILQALLQVSLRFICSLGSASERAFWWMK